MKTERVLFIENAELQQIGGGGPRYDAGKVYDLRPDQAQRWYARGKAVPAPDEVAEAAPSADETTTKFDAGASAVTDLPTATVPADTLDVTSTVPAPDEVSEAAPSAVEAGRARAKKGGKKS